jgi:hypothetical protein
MLVDKTSVPAHFSSYYIVITSYRPLSMMTCTSLIHFKMHNNTKPDFHLPPQVTDMFYNIDFKKLWMEGDLGYMAV